MTFHTNLTPDLWQIYHCSQRSKHLGTKIELLHYFFEINNIFHGRRVDERMEEHLMIAKDKSFKNNKDR